jgi:FkbM family methyltransferase
MIKTIHRHTFREDLLIKGGYVLDLGCSDFIFTRYMLKNEMKVISLDPRKNIYVFEDLLTNPNFTFLEKACVGVKNGDTAPYHTYQHWGSNSLINTPEMLSNETNLGHSKNPFKETYNVKVTTIAEIMSEFNIDKFELIKMDVEGMEYEILSNLPDNCSKQISIEFHDFLSLNPSDDIEEYHIDLLKNNLSTYKVEYEDKSPLNGFKNTFQRDDVLYIEK